MRKKLIMAGAALAGAAVAAVVVLPGAASARPQADDHSKVQAALDKFRTDNGALGAAVAAGDRNSTWSLSSGTARLGTQTRLNPTDKVKVASNTKMFVASVVLQLVAERRAELDAPIERYLPGLVKGNGYDGNKITVRQLLQHTSGIAEFMTPDMQLNPLAYISVHKPEELIAHALQNKPKFAPGTDWSYSNTNFIIAGMLIEKITGHYVGDEISARILTPLGLRDTDYPKPGKRTIDGPHVRGYLGRVLYVDVTETEPSLPGAAGEIVSTPADMMRFVRALADGKVVPPAQLAEMRKTFNTKDIAYGLGLYSQDLSCGGVAWGHNGAWAGYHTEAMATDDGRQAFAVINSYPLLPPAGPPISGVIDAALCSGKATVATAPKQMIVTE